MGLRYIVIVNSLNWHKVSTASLFPSAPPSAQRGALVHGNLVPLVHARGHGRGHEVPGTSARHRARVTVVQQRPPAWDGTGCERSRAKPNTPLLGGHNCGDNFN